MHITGPESTGINRLVGLQGNLGNRFLELDDVEITFGYAAMKEHDTSGLSEAAFNRLGVAGIRNLQST